MKKATKSDYIFFAVIFAIFGAWLYVIVNYMDDSLNVGSVFFAIFLTIPTLLLIGAIREIIWRAQNGVDVFATLETDPEKVKSHMLFVMQYGHEGGIKGAFKEFNDIFRNYPQWRLQDWEVFRAWYKHEIDHMLKYPEIYVMGLGEDGTPYSKEEDGMYDPDAPDWAQFDRDRSYDYDDDDDGDDDDDDDNFDGPRDSRSELRKAAEEGIMMGVGFGVANGILNK